MTMYIVTTEEVICDQLEEILEQACEVWGEALVFTGWGLHGGETCRTYATVTGGHTMKLCTQESEHSGIFDYAWIVG